MDHFTLNLRPKEYFQLAPNKRTVYIELCIFARSVPYGKYGKYGIMGADSQMVSKVSMVSMHNGPLHIELAP